MSELEKAANQSWIFHCKNDREQYEFELVGEINYLVDKLTKEGHIVEWIEIKDGE